MKLEFERDALDFLAALEAKQFKQVARKVFALLGDPLPSDSALLQGYNDLRRADIGEFRVIYQTGDDVVHIILIGRRNDDAVYRALARKMR